MRAIRQAARGLLKAPGFTLAAVVTLALGIGVNTAVFSVMNAVLLHPTGIPNVEQVVALRASYGALADLQNIAVSAPDFEDSRESASVFAAAGLMQRASFTFSREDARPEQLPGAAVSAGWFDVFQARPELGRTFRPEEDVPGANNLVVLSDRLWQQQFGGSASVLGQRLELNGQSYTVIGVMGRDYAWPSQAELWTPLALPPGRYHDANFRFNEQYTAVARLRPGVSLAQANAVEAALTQRVRGQSAFAVAQRWKLFAMPLRTFVAGSLRQPFLIMLAGAMLVLLIACGNIAGLQLARARERQHELAVRAALGASGAQLMAQPLAESALLGACGLGLGLMAAQAAAPAVLLLAPAVLGPEVTPGLDWRVLSFAAAAGVLAVVVCAAAPALQAARGRMLDVLRDGGRTGMSSRATGRLRRILVVGEVTLAMFLLVCSGLLTQSLKAVESLATGFEPRGVMTAAVTLPRALYDTAAKQSAFWQAAREKLEAIPGVTAAGLVDNLPFSNAQGSASFLIQGRPVAPNEAVPHGHVDVISPGYFRTLGIRRLRGRGFTDGDRANTRAVAIVDEALARQYWPGQDALGQSISLDGGKTWALIVGEVQHVKVSSLEAETKEGTYYVPVAQAPARALFAAVRTTETHPEALQGAIQAAIAEVDAHQPIADARTMQQRVDDTLGGRRLVVALLGIFSGLALFLAAIGLYGVVAYFVRMRVREIGLRMALGAPGASIAGMVMRQGAAMTAAGCGLGVALTFSAGRAISGMLFGVTLYDVRMLAMAGAGLAVVVLLASYLPVRRAVRIDPAQALRQS